MAGLREFVVEFGSEEKCIEHLAGLRWPGGFACAGCGGRQAWRLKARPRVYECAACHRQESVTAGTVDSNHRSPSEIVVDPSGSRRDHRAKYCPPGKTQHLLPNSVFDRPGSDRWNLASTTFPDAGTDASNPVPSSGEMLWGGRRGWQLRRCINRWSALMPQPNDLSRSLVALDQNSTIIAVVEMSQSSWLVGGMLPGIERQPQKKLEPSAERLLGLLHRWRDEAVRA